MTTYRPEDDTCADRRQGGDVWNPAGTDWLPAAVALPAAGHESAFELGRQTGRAEDRRRIREAYDNPEPIIGSRRKNQPLAAWRLNAVMKALDGGL